MALHLDGMKQVDPLPYDPATYKSDTFDPVRFPVAPFTPKVLICPTDDEPLEAHSYVLNMHLSDKGIRAATRDFGGLRSSEVIVAGEKRNTVHDYYMARNDFHRVVDEFKHGAQLGSNYLFFDGHVDNTPPNEQLAGMDRCSRLKCLKGIVPVPSQFFSAVPSPQSR